MGEICFYYFSHIVYDNENRREDMMFDVITILYQCGTEFHLRYSGTQFHFPSTLQKSKFPILEVEAQQRGVMSMRTKIEIHDDYCHDMDSAEIEFILTQVTALITDAVLRATYQSEDAA